nr:hypothetical protein [Tanacetum cinerariifolium]
MSDHHEGRKYKLSKEKYKLSFRIQKGMKVQVCLYGTTETSKEIESRSVLEMDMGLRESFKDYKDSYEKSRIQVFYKEILNQYHLVSGSFGKQQQVFEIFFQVQVQVQGLRFCTRLLKIQVAQKKVKIAFENADSSSRVELIPSKIKYANKVVLNFHKEFSVFSSLSRKENDGLLQDQVFKNKEEVVIKRYLIRN